MKKISLILMMTLFLLSVNIFAQSGNIASLAQKTAKAYKAKRLEQLDALKLVQGKVKLVIEHSLVEDPQFEYRSFKSFRQMDRWIQKREKEYEVPATYRQLQSFTGCRKGLCKFFTDGGILHNQLYLMKIAYGFRKGRLYIKSLHFLDGD